MCILERFLEMMWRTYWRGRVEVGRVVIGCRVDQVYDEVFSKGKSSGTRRYRELGIVLGRGSCGLGYVLGIFFVDFFG